MGRLAYSRDEDDNIHATLEHVAFLVGQFAPKLHEALRDVKAITHSRYSLDKATNEAFGDVMDALNDALMNACNPETGLGLDVGLNLSAELRKAARGN